MAILGFNFTKIQAEKKKTVAGAVKINNNARITKIVPLKISLGTTDKQGLVFEFEYTSNYEPKLAQMTFIGNVMFSDTDESMKKILADWKKNQTVDQSVGAPILNQVLNRCTIQGMFLSKELSIPPPIKLPKIAATPARAPAKKKSK